MPTYEYVCFSCGVQFDAAAKVVDRQKNKPCPACQQEAVPRVPSQVQGHFSKEVTGPGPQNSGVQGLDAHIDRVIGQSAKQGWDVAEKRVHDKRDVLNRHPEVSGKDLSKNPDGSYRILKKEERGVHERALAIHTSAMNWMREVKKKAPR